MEPDLTGPAADVEGVGQANQDVDDIKVNIMVRREPPRQQGERKQRDAIGRQGDGHIAEPSVAEGHVTVLVVDIETMDLAEEEDEADDGYDDDATASGTIVVFLA